MPSLSWYFYKGQQVLLIPGKLLLLAFQGPANFFQSFKDRLLDEVRQHGYEVEADIEALAEVVRVDRLPLELQDGLDGYAPEPEGPTDPKAEGEGDPVSAIGPPVDGDVGGHADLPGTGQHARQEVLDVLWLVSGEERLPATDHQCLAKMPPTHFLLINPSTTDGPIWNLPWPKS
jgi:hypothetical protein